MAKGINLVCFDLNKTLILENTWYNLNLEMGISNKEDHEMYELFELGELSYSAWQKKLEKIYKKRGRANKARILKTVYKYTYLPGAREIIDYIKSKSYKIALISGSIDILVKKIAEELSIDYFKANNSFVFGRNDYLKEINCIGDDRETKLIQLQQLCKDLSIDIETVACIGDGDNDIELFKRSKHGITFNGSRIEKYAWRTIDKLLDIRNIL